MSPVAAPKSRKTTERPMTTYHQVDWKSETAITDFVGSRWDTRQKRMGQLERQWYTNIAFYMGQQWLTWNDESRTLQNPEVPPWRVRLTINLVQGVARKNVSKILRNSPIWSVAPATGSQDDIQRARVGEKAARSYWKGQLKMDRRLANALSWMCVTGTSAIRLYWDPRKGPSMNATAEEVGDDEEAKKIIKQRGKKGVLSINQGDAQTELASPFELDPDPAATTPEDLTHIIHSRLRPVTWVEERYGAKAKDLEPDASETKRYYERKISDLAGPNGFGGFYGGARDSDRDEGQIVVHDVWGLAVKGFPKGVHAVVAGEKVMAVEANDYTFAGEPALPFAFFREIEVPGRFWGTCALEQAIPLQANLNRARSQLVENRNLMTRPKWLVPKGSGVADYALTSEPGEVIEHTPGLEPTPWTPPSLPSYVIRELEATRQDFQDVTNLHEVSNAQAPPNVRSGVAISALQEQDETILLPTIQAIGNELEKLGSMLLEILSRKVTEKRLVRIVGDAGSDFHSFIGKELAGEEGGVDYFDVHVQMGSQLPYTKDGRRNYVAQLVQAGILDPQNDRKKIFELLELGTDEPLYDEQRLDTANAQSENRDLMEPENGLLDVHPWDDPETHLTVLRLFQKTPEYAKRREEDDSLDERFEDHAVKHEEQMPPPPVEQPLAPPMDPAMMAPPPMLPPQLPPQLPPEMLPAPPPPVPEVDLSPPADSIIDALVQQIAANRMSAT